MQDQLTKISKYLSKHLRHQPEKLGLVLGSGGWVEVDKLLEASRRAGFPITREELEEVVATNNKQRFSFDHTGQLIRANQGHSVEVDLQLESVEPPDTLYHGTGQKNLEAILQTGLKKMSRHHVHLSIDKKTARIVGSRHGRPIIFRVDSAVMKREGYIFYRSENGVWLTEKVPVKYLDIVEDC